MTGHNYPDHFYADALASKQTPTGAYRSTDPVTKPAYYQRAGIETIDYIRATLDGPGFEAYCIGNVLKYVSRYREKGGVEDLRKAQVYLGWAIAPPEKQADPAAAREAKVAYDSAWDRARDQVTLHELLAWQAAYHRAGIGDVPHKRVPKWHPDWPDQPPNCDGLSARDVRGPHPMASEVIREHDERLAGGEDRL